MNILFKIYQSEKVKILRKLLLELPYYFADSVLIAYSLFKNLLVLGTPYDKRVVIVSASDERFAETILQLIENLHSYKFYEKLIIYDLGMNSKQLEKININYPEVIIKKFNFDEVPDFVGQRDDHGLLGFYAWKPNIIVQTLEKYKSKVIWLDSANLIDWKFIFVLIVLSNKHFFSPISAGKVIDFTHEKTIETVKFPSNKLNKRNLTGGFNGFDWNHKKSMEIANLWRDFSNIQEVVFPKEITKRTHRWDQSILTLLIYKYNYFGYLPKMKKVFGIKVNQNPNQDFFLFESKKNVYSSKLYLEWYKNYKNFSTKTIKYSKLIWILDYDDINKIPKKFLKNKKVLCNVYENININELTSNPFIDAFLIFDEKISLPSMKQTKYVNNQTTVSEFKEILESFKNLKD